jgi:hypothetical protein
MENRQRVTIQRRHPRESGDPDFQARRRRQSWIPAFAGMTVWLACSTASLATETLKAPVPLDGPAIIKTFEGKTVKGVYADGTPVQESYKVGGGIDYWDSFRTSTGTWSVVNGLFCTFYNATEMSGGCFRVEQVSANCFDYFALAGSTEEALKPTDKPRYTARAHILGAPDTCPDELSV